MPDNTGVTFGLSPESTARLRTLAGRFARFDSDAGLEAHKAMAEAAALVEESIKREFAPHDHGVPQGYLPPHFRTIDTTKVEFDGFSATVSIGGAAAYIEYGTTAHWIAPTKPGGVLHWSENGQDFFSKGHMVSGIQADDFIGRAIEGTPLERIMSRIFSQSVVKAFGPDREL